MGEPKAAARDVIGEILREREEHYRHLTAQGLKPQPPVHLAGVLPEELVAAYQAIVLKAKAELEERVDRDGVIRHYRQRKSATILGTAICSYPGPPDHADPNYMSWRERVVAWAMDHYEGHLIGVYEHRDEKQGHVHVVFHNHGRNVKARMAGHGAALDAAREGEPPPVQATRYRESCRAFQDDFQRQVGMHVGLGRLGPEPRPRKSWAQAQVDRLLSAECEAMLQQARERQTREQAATQRMAEWLRERVADGDMKVDEADAIAAKGQFTWREASDTAPVMKA